MDGWVRTSMSYADGWRTELYVGVPFSGDVSVYICEWMAEWNG